MRLKRFAHPGWLFAFVALGYCGYVGVQMGGTYFSAKRDDDRIRNIVASEELLLALTPELGKLSKGIQNIRFPDAMSLELFHDSIGVTDLAAVEPAPAAEELGHDVQMREWPTGERNPAVSSDSLTMWRKLLDRVSYIEHAKFYFIRGKFEDANLTEFVSDIGLKALARLGTGRWAGVSAKQQVRWRRVGDGDPAWRISAWDLRELRTIESPKLLFTEVLVEALPDARDLDRARHSPHQEAVLQFYERGGKYLPWKYFTPISANQRPGISVVDIDQDGHDDLYIMERRGPNLLLRNQGDGTFREEAAKWGLDISHFCSCGIFADFDNDGDPDLMLGRSMERSMYLENTGSRFVERQVSESANPLPYLVVSMSAVDYNRDGLLDVYFCTYRPAVLESIITDESRDFDSHERTSAASSTASDPANAMSGVAEDSKRWTDEFLSRAQAAEYERRMALSHDRRDEHFGRILDQIGPPNVLLINRGQGRFEVAPESDQLAVWRNTLQATWADFDDDGDPDVYIANDWATDNLFCNDGKGGFIEVTQEMGTTEFGFAMGVSWGDYDRDGYQDIYISNMYSKAGRRITSQIAELNPAYGRSVEGNFLYRGSNSGFQLVSGLEPPAMLVAEAGWSWGGQFADFDNDSFLDLYVCSGYFTAPDAFSSDVDL